MTLHEQEQVVVLEPQGSLYEGAECDALERTLAELAEGGRRVVVDLSGAKHVTARCLGILAHLQEVARQHGGRIVVCGADDQERWLLVTTGLATPLGLAGSRAEALRELEERTPTRA